jgi:chorismate mutase / prephenate dehydrogenase
MADIPPEIAAMRAAIDEVDHAILALCAQRRSIVADLYALKARAGLPLLDPGREAELLAERRAFAERLGVPRELAAQIVRALLDASHAQMLP